VVGTVPGQGRPARAGGDLRRSFGFATAALLGVAACTPAGNDAIVPETTTTAAVSIIVPDDPSTGPGGGDVRIVTDTTFRIRVVVPEGWAVSPGEASVAVAADAARWVAPPAPPDAAGFEVEVLDVPEAQSSREYMAAVHDGRIPPSDCDAGGPDALPPGLVGMRETYRCAGGVTVDLTSIAVDDSTLLLAASVVTTGIEDAALEQMLATVAVGPSRPADGFRTDASGRIGVVFSAASTWRFFAEVGTVAATPDVGGWVAGYGGSGSGAADTPGFLITVTDFEEPATLEEMAGLIDQTLADLFVVPDGCERGGREPFKTAILAGLSEPFTCDNGFEGSVAIVFDPAASVYAATVVTVLDPTDPDGAALVRRAVDSVVVTTP
jgi:hypothetical protein